jgi:hypothetical protein
MSEICSFDVKTMLLENLSTLLYFRTAEITMTIPNSALVELMVHFGPENDSNCPGVKGLNAPENQVGMRPICTHITN